MNYWRQIRWNRYRLITADGQSRDFDNYEALHRHCRKFGIDAQQA